MDPFDKFNRKKNKKKQGIIEYDHHSISDKSEWKKQEENKYKADYFLFIRGKKLDQDIEENKNNMSKFMLDLNPYAAQEGE